MKRSSIVYQVALLAAVGCSPQPAPVADSSGPQSSPTVQTEQGSDSEATTFVSLKVPNMV